MRTLLIAALLLGFTVGFLFSHDQPTTKFHKYDINQDGAVTPLDVNIIINYLNNSKV